MVKAPLLKSITVATRVIVAPLPLEIKIPASLTTIEAPLALRKITPPVGGTGGITGGGTDGGMSLTITACCNSDWITILGSAGLPACAAFGTSAVVFQNRQPKSDNQYHLVQILSKRHPLSSEPQIRHSAFLLSAHTGAPRLSEPGRILPAR